MRLSFICSFSLSFLPGVSGAWLCIHQSVTGPVTRSTYGKGGITSSSTLFINIHTIHTITFHDAEAFMSDPLLLSPSFSHIVFSVLSVHFIINTVDVKTFRVYCQSVASGTCEHFERPIETVLLSSAHQSVALSPSPLFLSSFHFTGSLVSPSSCDSTSVCMPPLPLPPV